MGVFHVHHIALVQAEVDLAQLAQEVGVVVLVDALVLMLLLERVDSLQTLFAPKIQFLALVCEAER